MKLAGRVEKVKAFKIGEFEVFWLDGGVFDLDGGTMFGPVPRAMWAKKLPPDGENCIRLTNSPLLVRAGDALVIVDTGLGNKLTEKQKKIYRVTSGWDMLAGLRRLGLGPGDVTHVVLTHCDFDHAGGVVMLGEGGRPALTFPNAQHVVQQAEWEDVKNPNERAAHSYWPENFAGLEASGRLRLLEGDGEVAKGISVVLTGGHTRGHQAVRIESGGMLAVQMGDLLPTHAHFNPLWVTSYDNFPLDAIEKKKEMESECVSRGAWFLFYHDPSMRACRFGPDGEVLETLGWG